MSNLTNQSLNVVRTQNHFYEYNITGLDPNTVHQITIDDVDHGFATKQNGKDFGEALISNADGELSIGVLFELRFPRDQNFELPRVNTLQFQNEQLASENRKTVNTVNNFRVLEVASFNGSSRAQLVLRINSLLNSGPVRTLYPID